MHEITLFNVISLLSSLADVARLNTLLGVIFKRPNRLKMINVTSVVEDRQRPPQFWKKPGRTSAWWAKFQKDTVIPDELRETFCMSKDTFTKLCTQLRPFIEKTIAKMCVPISVQTHVVVTLYYLSDEGRCRK